MNPIAAFVCLCMVAVCATGEKTGKAKRDVSGLFPFPRVGRDDPSWNYRYFGPAEVKRQGLIPFPRIGRNGGDGNSEKKREMAENGGAMWFGPRLGRLQKRKYFNEQDWALVRARGFALAFSHPPSIKTTEAFERPPTKLQQTQNYLNLNVSAKDFLLSTKQI